ncbi:MAG: rRNA pseudouridine synthase [Desulfamplus sp.]|nr:rRNA pseudouridine synthase [Desulfamplus sp.]MBF0413266.1 rRNA pseudouridine synthase [Desulfamplus sp.]
MRLQKFLSQAGICSRRKGEEYIIAGFITVNGTVVTQLGTSIDVEKDEVRFQGKIVNLSPEKKKIYIALNKPIGFITSCSHSHQGDKIVLDIINIPDRIYPIGRLDKESSGLILLTDDGELHNKLSHPSYNHEKEYIVTTVEPVSKSALEKMAAGVMLDGKKTRPAEVLLLSRFKFRIILKQGVNRQIRRMVEKTGNQVKELIRIRIGNITIDKLKVGKWRYLNEDEINKLKNSGSEKL